MDWTEVDVQVGRRWERADGYAVVNVRETADGQWAVSSDRLEQAPEGDAYEHTTVETKEEALDVAADYRSDR